MKCFRIHSMPVAPLKSLMIAFCLTAATLAINGCRSPATYREASDAVVERHLTQAQQQVLGHTEEINISTPEETLRRRLLVDQNLAFNADASMGLRAIPANEFWQPGRHLDDAEAERLFPVPTNAAGRLTLSLLDAQQLAARSSRAFQKSKEDLFLVALGLDLEEDAFRQTFSGLLKGGLEGSSVDGQQVSVGQGSSDVGVTKKMLNGVELSSMIAIDLVKLFTQETASSLGLLADASISIPLLRGAGRRIASETLTQAQRDLLYAVHEFETFKRHFAVQLASDYLNVLLQRKQLSNVDANYARLRASAKRAQRMSEAGRLPEVQYDQAVQEELRARTRWIDAELDYRNQLDRFKVSLALPPDADFELDEREFDRIMAITNSISYLTALRDDEDATENRPAMPSGKAPFLQLNEGDAMRMALTHRLDLRTALARVDDAQRAVYIRADALRPEVSLLGRASSGGRRSSAAGARATDARLNGDSTSASGLLTIDLGLERTAESYAYRTSLLALQETVRQYQAQEDSVKVEVRNAIREMARSHENLVTQMRAVTLAHKRTRSTDLFLQAGRVEIRDVLESEEALLSAQNSLNAAMVNYRIAELTFQRDMG
ncbi:MAG: TolC family protein, partial [Verrucomicrobia bacterium]|nr:TolC family protein [Verrucomicrobiota bacterium]